MAMGIVSDEDFDKEIGKTIPINDHAQIIEIEKPGRKDGDNNVPDALRKIIGETSELDGRQEALELAESFGISPSSVSAYSAGAKSTATYNETPNKLHIDGGKERIQSKARKILFQSLNNITPDKLNAERPLTLAHIARQMSGIVKELEPENENDKKGPLAQFVIMCPPTREEKTYEIIQSKDGM